MTTREAGEELGVSDTRIRQFIREGRLRAERMGHIHALRKKDVLALGRQLAEDAPHKRGPKPHVLRKAMPPEPDPAD